MDTESKYFTLSMESLRAIAGWSADCAERALAVYEARDASDARPREAIAAIREFAAGGKRAARLRTLALAAHAAAREIGEPAAAAAARSADTAAASAYTHPLRDVHQTKHVVGAAAYAALALELDSHGDETVANREIRWAIDHAPPEAGEVLLEMPAREPGKSRLDNLMWALDAGIRVSTRPSDAAGSERFYHGTRADLKPGDLIGPGYLTNYGTGKKANHVYFSATLDAAIWGAELAAGEGPARIYVVEPTGPMMDDPNLTDKKFPGNPTRSYRSREPVRIVGEVTEWERHPEDAIKAMKDNIARLREQGIEAADD